MEKYTYTESLGERFSTLINEEWAIDDGHTIVDIAARFSIDMRLARYYLMNGVDSGKLCQIKIGRNTYYALACWKEPFKRFRHLGVKVL